jgi:DNA repair protein RadC
LRGKVGAWGERKEQVAEPAGANAADDEALLSLLAAGLRLQSTDSLWRVSGNTLPHRAVLRDAGGTWNRLDSAGNFTARTRQRSSPRRSTAVPARARPQQRRARRGQPALSRPSRPGARAGAEGGIERWPTTSCSSCCCSMRSSGSTPSRWPSGLLERFGTVGDVFAAEAAQLREFEIDQRTLVLFRAVREAAGGWPSARSRTCRC